MAGLTHQQLCKWLPGVNVEGEAAGEITGFAIDSREIEPGWLFFALRGARLSGVDFLEEVARRKGRSAFVPKEYSGPRFGLQLLRVDDVRSSLQELAKRYLEHLSVPVIAVSGSVGKTTTKDFLASLLGARYRVVASVGSQNTQLTVPLTLLRAKPPLDLFVLEMGMTAPGHLARLVDIAPPDMALLTAVELVHAEGFSSLEGIAQAKAELLSHPKTRLGIIPRSLTRWEAIGKAPHPQKLIFELDRASGGSDADYSLEGEGERLIFRLSGGERVESSWQIPGAHNRHNLLAAVACAHAMGVNGQEIADSIPSLKLPSQRLQPIDVRGIHVIDDAYNACEVSMCQALDAMPEPGEGGRRIALFGEMRELGGFSDECHTRVAAYALDRLDLLLCVGVLTRPMLSHWRLAGRYALWFPGLAEAGPALRAIARPGDVVLIKGARALACEKLIAMLL